ncbi:hypothetical protein ALC62_13042 [Cyphomyrmex costatus]|uniref:Uncharacterized protein n=1 Tax=Cyphomyrmex costatus TaxID=456900 RepID=A0A195C6Y0_9HYME|nr:hypothetical protein ALC62_13042 [Cyphomyrmex costatus]
MNASFLAWFLGTPCLVTNAKWVTANTRAATLASNNLASKGGYKLRTTSSTRGVIVLTSTISSGTVLLLTVPAIVRCLRQITRSTRRAPRKTAASAPRATATTVSIPVAVVGGPALLIDSGELMVTRNGSEDDYQSNKSKQDPLIHSPVGGQRRWEAATVTSLKPHSLYQISDANLSGIYE